MEISFAEWYELSDFCASSVGHWNLGELEIFRMRLNVSKRSSTVTLEIQRENSNLSIELYRTCE